MKYRLLCICGLVFLVSYLPCKGQKHPSVSILIPASASPRIQFGASRLSETLQKCGYAPKLLKQNNLPSTGRSINIGIVSDTLMLNVSKIYGQELSNPKDKEGFSISTMSDQGIVILGTDQSGVLYGCLELAERLKSTL